MIDFIAESEGISMSSMRSRALFGKGNSGNFGSQNAHQYSILQLLTCLHTMTSICYEENYYFSLIKCVLRAVSCRNTICICHSIKLN